MSRAGWILSLSAMGLVALLVSLALLAVLTRPQDAKLLDALHAAARDRQPKMNADFSELFPGDWDRMVIACRGAAPADVDGALGFHWDRGRDLKSDSFLSTILFVRDDAVEATLSTGADSGWVYVPCPIGVDSTDAVSPSSAVLPRSSAVVQFTHHPDADSDFWYVDAAEFHRLAEAG